MLIADRSFGCGLGVLAWGIVLEWSGCQRPLCHRHFLTQVQQCRQIFNVVDVTTNIVHAALAQIRFGNLESGSLQPPRHDANQTINRNDSCISVTHTLPDRQHARHKARTVRRDSPFVHGVRSFDATYNTLHRGAWKCWRFSVRSKITGLGREC